MHDSTDIHRNNTVGMQYNTNNKKKKKLNNVLCTEIEYRKKMYLDYKL